MSINMILQEVKQDPILSTLKLNKMPAFLRAANNFSFLKGHMSDQVSILVGQNRNVVGRLF